MTMSMTNQEWFEMSYWWKNCNEDAVFSPKTRNTRYELFSSTVDALSVRKHHGNWLRTLKRENFSADETALRITLESPRFKNVPFVSSTRKKNR
ncbi:hypothetical protein AVEN_152586-1 [Araneus ventricosus]|uniref:Uncharacterized protein n=1 Tax=Araneus ventricosus TaxID=182803 RepID=A0A4Y2FVK0_ARAVE|nr:hypothetical protein AVEN_152586-1 [Araneus ventricosus]